MFEESAEEVEMMYIAKANIFPFFQNESSPFHWSAKSKSDESQRVRS
jgi:hypothetical protein